MNFYIDSGGTIIAVDPERVYQGSAMANTIRLIAPFPLGASVTVSYILPDGTQMQPQLMTANKTLSGVQTETGVNFSVWEQNIGVRFEQVNGVAKAVPDFTVLSQVGKVGVVFNITQANATGQPIKQTTARSSFLCERGAPLERPTEAFDDYKSLLNQILGQLSVAVQNDIYLEQAIQDVENSIEEVDQKYEQSVTELEDGKVNLAGDTMTGPLKVEDTSTAGPESTDYTAQGVEIIDERNRDYTSYKKDSICRVIADGDEFVIRLPRVGGTLARESQIQDAEEWISSAIDGIREDIRNEAHFRGYVATNAEIQALPGTPNDYAYSAESGTVWIYQGNAWTNSGRPVPDQSTPASNSTPLMDGTASAGIAESYARGDHVHPTDTTLAKTIDGQILTFGDGSKSVNLRLYNTEDKLISSSTFALPEGGGSTDIGLESSVGERAISLTPYTNEEGEVKYSPAYQRFAICLAYKGQAGLTSGEFAEKYPSGVDNWGDTYKESYSVAFAEGLGAKALGRASHAQNRDTQALSDDSSASGVESIASGANGSNANGFKTKATGEASFTANKQTIASGEGAAAFGIGGDASGAGAFKTGHSNTSKGAYSFTEGQDNVAEAWNCYAGGYKSKAKAQHSYVRGEGLESVAYHQTVFGKYNVNVSSSYGGTLPVLTVGYGNSYGDRRDVFNVLRDGRAKIYGTPKEDNDVTHKKYVDELVLGNGAGGTKLYLHTIDALKLVSNDSTPITVNTLIAAFRDSISAHWAENTVLSIARMGPTSITLFGVRVDFSTSALTHVSYSIDFNLYTDTVTEL